MIQRYYKELSLFNGFEINVFSYAVIENLVVSFMISY